MFLYQGAILRVLNYNKDSQVQRVLQVLVYVKGDVKGNGKVKVKVKFTLEQATMAQRRIRGIAVLFY